MSSSNSTDAPINDLSLLQEINVYTLEVDKPIRYIVLKKIGEHLWYLSEHLILLALFSNQVEIIEKQRMAKCVK